MERTEITKLLQEAGTVEDDVKRREILATLTEGIGESLDELDTLRTTNEELGADLEDLREANMKLFKQVGVNKSKEEDIKDTTGLEGEGKKKRKFEDLFNEKGELDL